MRPKLHLAGGGFLVLIAACAMTANRPSLFPDVDKDTDLSFRIYGTDFMVRVDKIESNSVTMVSDNHTESLEVMYPVATTTEVKICYPDDIVIVKAVRSTLPSHIEQCAYEVSYYMRGEDESVHTSLTIVLNDFQAEHQTRFGIGSRRMGIVPHSKEVQFLPVPRKEIRRADTPDIVWKKGLQNKSEHVLAKTS